MSKRIALCILLAIGACNESRGQCHEVAEETR